MEQAVINGVSHVTLSGGEPLTIGNLEDYLRIADCYNMGLDLFSNLTLYNESTLELIKKYNILRVVTSLESDIPEVHDGYRGMEGAFDKTVNAIKSIVGEGINLEVNVVIGPHNQGRIEPIVKFIRSLGAKVKLDATSPLGRAADMNLDYPAYAKELVVLSKKVDLQCGIGDVSLYIDCSGDMKLCSNINDPRYIFGNIYQQYDLADIHRKCRALHVSPKECPGCRARAFALSGDLTGEDLFYTEVMKECR